MPAVEPPSPNPFYVFPFMVSCSIRTLYPMSGPLDTQGIELECENTRRRVSPVDHIDRGFTLKTALPLPLCKRPGDHRMLLPSSTVLISGIPALLYCLDTKPRSASLLSSILENRPRSLHIWSWASLVRAPDSFPRFATTRYSRRLAYFPADAILSVATDRLLSKIYARSCTGTESIVDQRIRRPSQKGFRPGICQLSLISSARIYVARLALFAIWLT